MGEDAEYKKQEVRAKTGSVPEYVRKFSGGGKVPGSGPNKDTVPAMLTPGEFVMSRGAVQEYGADTLESMNAMGGGTNMPIRLHIMVVELFVVIMVVVKLMLVLK